MKHLYIITAFLFCCLSIIAQEQTKKESTITISGTVLDEFNAPIPGANVFLKDRPGVGTVTNMDGKFTIKGAQMGDVITLSFLGYEKQEVRIDSRLDRKNAQFKLKPSTNTLEETVVVGLGSQRKVSVVGAITNVDVKDLQTPATSIPNMLGGRVPGIISLQNSGEPGKNISEFWVRGIGTFGANQGALVLIDGLEGSLSQIDPADIESFSVLKDASATAVYGTRGANGVVLVTTKRGEVDKLKITGRVNLTVSHLQNMPEYLGAYDYAKLANEAKLARGEEELYSPMALDLIKYQLDPDLYPNVNWRDQILNKNSLQQTYYMSARGGGSVARYFFSLGMSNEDAAYKQEKSSKYSTDVAYRTYNYRSNIDVNLTKTTTAYLGTEGYLSEKTEPGNVSTDALWSAQQRLTPLTIPLQYSTGELPAWGANNEYSPYVMLNHTGKAKWRRFTNKVTLAVTQDLPFITKGLKLRAQIAYDSESYLKEIRKVLPEMYYASGRTVDGTLIMRKVVDAQTATYNKDEESQWNKLHFESTLNYDRAFGDHRVGGLVYYYMSSYQSTWCDIHGYNCNVNVDNVPKRYQGLSGRLTYGFRDTYIIDLNFGYTGSENFQKGRRFGFFPSVALGWVPTNYDFVRETLPWLSFLKIRGSWGSVGNDRITNKRFPYLTIMNENANKGWNGSNGVTEQSVGADNLQWEKAIKLDLGIEGKLFNEQVDFTVDFFRDTRNDIFQQRTMVPDYIGLAEQPFGNVGSMVSYGADGNISFRQDIGKDFSFTLRGNFTYTANMVKNWEEAFQKYSYQERADKPYEFYSGYIALGLFRDENDVKFSPDQSGIAGRKVLPGDIKYKDVNGDGVINSDDQVPLSYKANYPRLMYGFGGEVRWKKLTLGFLFKGTGNVDNFCVDGYKAFGFLPFSSGETGNTLAITANQANRWTPREISGDASTENPNAMFPRLSYGNDHNSTQPSTFWKTNARYLRLQEINLNYNLSAGKILKQLGVSSLDLQFVASNICVWSPFKHFDPEQAYYNGGAYPIPARYAFQMYINF